MEYKINSQNGIVVVSIIGNITRNDVDAVMVCKTEILSGPSPRAVILNFKGLTLVEAIAFRELTLLQHDVRKIKSEIRIVGLSLPMRNLLSEKGVIRANEVGNSLIDVLNSL